MSKNKSYAYDYVSGYFKINQSKIINIDDYSGKVYAAIPVKFVHIKKSEYQDGGESPFSKAGWYFGRQYLNRVVYSI